MNIESPVFTGFFYVYEHIVFMDSILQNPFTCVYFVSNQQMYYSQKVKK